MNGYDGVNARSTVGEGRWARWGQPSPVTPLRGLIPVGSLALAGTCACRFDELQ